MIESKGGELFFSAKISVKFSQPTHLEVLIARLESLKRSFIHNFWVVENFNKMEFYDFSVAIMDFKASAIDVCQVRIFHHLQSTKIIFVLSLSKRVHPESNPMLKPLGENW